MDHLTIILEPGEEGGYCVFIPEVPGVVSQGETEEEAVDTVLDALRELTSVRRDMAMASLAPGSIGRRMPLDATSPAVAGH